MDISQTVALISGGASGLGAASARVIVAGGGKVVLLDRDAERGATLASELGEGARFAQTDVTSESSVETARDWALSEFGRITGAVNCAGIAIAAKTVGRDGAHPLADFQRSIDINLVGSFNVCRLAAEAMQDNDPNADGERGVLINTASVAAFDGQKGQPAYAASKGGIVGMTLPMARDLAGIGVRTMAIAPGLFLTPMLEGLPEAAQEALASQPLFPKRLGKPEEFGKLVRFIIESPYLNGSTVRLDGGIRMP
ncbi:NAD(P)-dependent dehydrogenase (short-subunit alcohol dehydrogenase family) [Litoreibacter ponti]|uniref:NAD(P)-dependent dehydrogenase (Short-subunit alcohol dehydrogenase family) n=1 Tax=Litoreibacter ponti TaxID=1510457 RepID=A0A2T6BJ78_9RHOB|nr:3-hydroxyacyl-CoA dehydrogenase [Litoreibacter ponti]PTX56118.1 NAD(P)-dependent dehydrogenase (short-subunit alcohol dehydrogenase family) [Litoreibacter ponti]